MNEMDKWEDIKDNFPYMDILELEHPTSKNHPRQPMESRAGQFSPYAALTGYGDAVKETERFTWDEMILDEDRKARLDEIMLYLQNSTKKEFIRILYFVKDKYKKGGSYKEIEGTFKKVDSYKNLFQLEGKINIPTKDIVKIEIINRQED